MINQPENNGVNVRELALGVMLEVTEEKEYSHIAIRNVLDKYQYMEKRDRAFLTRLCEGTLEQMIYLDYAATAPLRSEALEAMLPVFQENFGNADSLHAVGRRAAAALQGARDAVASVLGVQPSEVRAVGISYQMHGLVCLDEAGLPVRPAIIWPKAS